MTKIKESKFRSSRRLGVNICGSSKNSFNKRNYPPGVHGQSSHTKKLTTYATQLRFKQILRIMYGISEKQLRNIYLKSAKKKGDTGENMIAMLESRLMTVIYRSKFASSIYEARQLVGHAHFLVNNSKVNVPSYQLKVGDIISIKDKSRKLEVIKRAGDSSERIIPEYLSLSRDNMSISFDDIPSLSFVPNNSIIQIGQVIEYYSS
ncbi:30S ribosomal protein S4 [Lyticum sinuosum]|uniref:Small ribosomal subunit protein uS4 n=1 Tax=Lyticum sinuosum TaxID=1332059 RepID=A0AAE4VLS6_9RICK|nr:30S ribosomal protein S4 [Lyticum sinuosum]MDZ5761171.1 30S ribosomal protein S4 [Lyticum sinuosum]